jgi:DNA-binding NtrC family response regulator
MAPSADVRSSKRVIVVAPEGADWVAPTVTFLGARGYAAARLESLSFASFLVMWGGVAALLIDARMLGPGSAARIGHLRSARPSLRVVSIGGTGLDAKQALESGGTSYLTWPFAASDLDNVFPRSPGIALVPAQRG